MARLSTETETETEAGPGRSVREALEKPGIHQTWESSYRTDRNERFYERAFAAVLESLPPHSDSRFLDVGCGVGAHSLRLARAGFRVEAVDISPVVLERAREKVEQAGLRDRITVSRGNVLELPFASGEFSHVLCWGVLMHVPEIERAVRELARVTAPGGVVVVYEVNARAPEARLLRAALPRLAKSHIELRRTPAGYEHWTETASGSLMWRHADLRWLRQAMEGHGLSLRRRRAGQLSEMYTRAPEPLARLIHAINSAWFGRVRAPDAALGNILIFQKS